MKVTYNQQIRNPKDGSISIIQHKCEILEFVGKEFVKIKIYGSIYKGKANATPTVKRKSIVELKNHTYEHEG
jgi:Fe-S cluster assembly ATPase SufC